MVSSQRCGLAGSTLLSQVDVFIRFVPYFLPLLLYYIVSQNLPFKLLLQQWFLLHSLHVGQSTFFIACPNHFEQITPSKPTIFEELIYMAFCIF